MGIPDEIKKLNTVEECISYYNEHESEREKKLKRYNELRKKQEEIDEELGKYINLSYEKSDKPFILARIGEIISGIEF